MIFFKPNKEKLIKKIDEAATGLRMLTGVEPELKRKVIFREMGIMYGVTDPTLTNDAKKHLMMLRSEIKIKGSYLDSLIGKISENPGRYGFDSEDMGKLEELRSFAFNYNQKNPVYLRVNKR
jgi:hypothetical protein